MTRFIHVMDTRTGDLAQRRSDTLTIDLPADFDPEKPGVTVDNRSRASYVSVNGKQMTRDVLVRPLSWRIEGERCLVADDDRAATIDRPKTLTLRTVHPLIA